MRADRTCRRWGGSAVEALPLTAGRFRLRVTQRRGSGSTAVVSAVVSPPLDELPGGSPMVTISDVASRAGVGAGTVSRVLNGSPKVSPGTRTRVLEAMAALDFRPNPLAQRLDRKSTRLNSSHSQISYAVFCLKKKNIDQTVIH